MRNVKVEVVNDFKTAERLPAQNITDAVESLISRMDIDVIDYQIFGSRVWGGSTDESDIDVIIHTSNEIPNDTNNDEYNKGVSKMFYIEDNDMMFNVLIFSNGQQYELVKGQFSIVNDWANKREMVTRTERIFACKIAYEYIYWSRFEIYTDFRETLHDVDMDVFTHTILKPKEFMNKKCGKVSMEQFNEQIMQVVPTIYDATIFSFSAKAGMDQIEITMEPEDVEKLTCGDLKITEI